MTLSYDAPLDAPARPAANPLDLPAALSVAAAGLVALSSRGAVDLLVGLPLLLGATRLARRGSLAGHLLWMGALVHLTSSSARAVLGARDTPLVAVHVAAVAAGLYALLDLLLDVDADAVKAAFGARAPVRSVGAFLALAGVALAAPVALPAALLAGAVVWRRGPWGFVLAGALLPPATLAALTAATHTPSGEPARALAFALLGAVGAGLGARYLRSIERPAASLPALSATSPSVGAGGWGR